MAEVTTATQVVQIGKETTPGTAVAAGKRLSSLSVSMSPNPEVSTFKPKGGKHPTLQVMNREWSTLSVEGQPTYDELAYLLASTIDTPTITPGAGDDEAWLFESEQHTADTPVTYTLEEGSSVRAHRVAHGLFDSFGLEFSREQVSVSGGGFAYALEDGVTMTSTPTELPLVPITPGSICVFMDPTSGALGTTKLNRVLSGAINVTGRWGPLWTVNCDLESFATYVELAEPEVSVTLTVEADAQGMALLDDLRSGEGSFLQIESIGPEIGGGVDHSFNFDAFTKVSGVGEYADEQGVYALEFTLRAHYDSTWGRAFRFGLTNTLAAL